MKHSVTEQGRRPKGNKKGIHIIVIILQSWIFCHGQDKYTKERRQTHHHDHQEPIAIC